MLKKYHTLFLAVSVLVIVFYLIMFLYNLPARDDYSYILKMQESSPWEIARNIYNNWNGRLAANFFYALFLPSLGFTSYKIITCAIFICFCCVIFTIFALSGLTRKKAFYIASLFICVMLLSVNYPRDIFYWMGGVANYFLPLTIFLFAVIPLVKKMKHCVIAVSSAALCFICSMCSEIFTVLAIMTIILALSIAVYRKDSYRIKLAAILFVALSAGLLIMFFAPGNAYRAGDREMLSLGMVIWKSIMTTLERSGDWLFLSPLIPAAMAISTVLKDHPMKISNHHSHIHHAIFFFLMALLFCLMPHIIHAYSLARPGLPGRGKFIAQFFFQSFMFLSILYFIKSRHIDSRIANSSLLKTCTSAAFFILVLVNFLPSVIYINKMGGYYKSVIERIHTIKNSSSDCPEIDTYPYQPRFMNDQYFFKNHRISQAKVLGKECFTMEGNDGYKNTNIPGRW